MSKAPRTPPCLNADPLPAPLQPRGRGARSNRTNRFEDKAYEPFDDGWRDTDPEPGQLRTVTLIDSARTIVTRNTSPDISFNQSINPYRGCEHGCVYCYARPSHASISRASSSRSPRPRNCWFAPSWTAITGPSPL